MNITCVGFIGFGLIGGSIARSIRKLHPEYKIVAYNYYKNQKNPNLEAALQEGTLTTIVTNLEQDFSDCDIIFLCAPVLKNIEYLTTLKNHMKPTCILTDVGSVKGNIHNAIKALDMEPYFIGGHPMAGSEKTGYQNSTRNLLENAYYILTPTPKTPSSITDTLYRLVTEIGAIPILLDASEHDNITAAISHVPHIIAAALVNMIQDNDTEEKMRSLAAGGFKDITRIASSSPIMWENICLTNRLSIIKFLTIFQDSLNAIEHNLIQENSKEILSTFERAKEYRDSIPTKSIGLIQEVFEVYIDIIDETGAIATIATILASNTISIKNIGILHNREFQDGALRIELYDQPSKEKTVSLLKQYRYTIYER